MEKPKLIQRFAERFSVDPNKLFDMPMNIFKVLS